jgi:hypothetical protein
MTVINDPPSREEHPVNISAAATTAAQHNNSFLFTVILSFAVWIVKLF